MQARYLILHLRNPLASDMHASLLTEILGGTTQALGDRVLIWTGEAVPVSRLENVRALAIGQLHAHPEGSAAAPLADMLVRVESLAALTRCAWGAYVTVGLDPEGDGCTVFRAPIGALPCYHAATQAGHVFGSDVDLLVDAGLVKPAISWAGLRNQLATTMMVREETCLEGVRELPPGCAIHLRSGTLIGPEPVWCCWNHIGNGPRTMEEASEALRQQILRSVRAMSGEYRSVAASVSGGVDSSIVLAALSEVGVAVRPFTMVGEDADADETNYVRPLARHLGLALSEFPFDSSDVDLTRSSVRHLPRPFGQTHAQSIAAKHRLMQDRFGADAVFTGMGGDSIFCTSFSALPLVDRLRCEGIGYGLIRTFGAVKAITQASGYRVLRQATRIALRGRRPSRASPVDRFLAPELCGRGVDPLGASWLRPPANITPGKRFHVEMLVQTLPGVEGFSRAHHPAFLSPLLAQPVVELCLRIPTWLWSASGLPRSVAREAFRPLLPAAISDRRSKGGPDSFSRDIALAQRATLRAMLLNGELVRRGLLDRDRLEMALDDRALLARSDHSKLLHLVDTEAWIAHWGARAADAGSPEAPRRAQRS